MEPRSCDRGITLYDDSVRYLDDASMEPRDHVTAEFTASGYAQATNNALQWSRDHVTAELYMIASCSTPMATCFNGAAIM